MILELTRRNGMRRDAGMPVIVVCPFVQIYSLSTYGRLSSEHTTLCAVTNSPLERTQSLFIVRYRTKDGSRPSRKKIPCK